MRLLYLLAIVFYPLAKASEQKTNIDLLETTMKNAVVTNQKEDRNCYAHSAYHMLNAYFHKNGVLPESIKLSPESLLATSYHDREKFITIHGRTCDQIENFKNNGSCEDQATLELLADILGDDETEFEGARKRLSSRLKRRSSRFFKDQACKTALTETLDQYSLGEVNPFIVDMRNIIRRNKDFSYRLFTNYLEEKCRGRNEWIYVSQEKIPQCERFAYKEVDEDNSKRMRLREPKEFIARIDKVISNGQPAGIAFCAEILRSDYEKPYIKNRDFPIDILEMQEYDFSKNYHEDCLYHASVITGRKVVNGKQYYGILNSWGPRTHTDAKHVILENGIYWIEQSILQDNIYKVYNLK